MLVFAPEFRHLLRPETLRTQLRFYKSNVSPTLQYVMLVRELSPAPRSQLLIAGLSLLSFYKDPKSQSHKKLGRAALGS